MIVISAGYYFGAGSFTALFMKNAQIGAYGTRFLRGLCLALPFLCVGVFQACGLGKQALAFALLRKIVLEILPAPFLLNLLFPLYGLAYAQLAAEVVLAAAAAVVLVRLFRELQCGIILSL